MSKVCTVSALFRRLRFGFRVVPFLRLSGNWLRDAGFESGCKVFVKVEDGTITIDRV